MLLLLHVQVNTVYMQWLLFKNFMLQLYLYLRCLKRWHLNTECTHYVLLGYPQNFAIFQRNTQFSPVSLLLLIWRDLEWSKNVYANIYDCAAWFSLLLLQNFCFFTVLSIEQQNVNFRNVMIFFFTKKVKKVCPTTRKICALCRQHAVSDNIIVRWYRKLKILKF